VKVRIRGTKKNGWSDRTVPYTDMTYDTEEDGYYEFLDNLQTKLKKGLIDKIVIEKKE
jgi:hypothetical protein